MKNRKNRVTKRVEKRWISTACIFVMSFALFAQTGIKGTVTEKSSGLAVPFASVALYQDGNILMGADTDMDGNYEFDIMTDSRVSLEVSFLGFASYRIDDVKINPDKTVCIDVIIDEKHSSLNNLIVVDDRTRHKEY